MFGYLIPLLKTCDMYSSHCPIRMSMLIDAILHICNFRSSIRIMWMQGIHVQPGPAVNPFKPDWRERRTELGLPDVDQHVGVSAVPHREVVVVAAIVVLYGLLLGAA